MKVILKEKIVNLGAIGDQIDVKSGYARNYLIPQGKALPCTEENIAHFTSIKKELEKAELEKLNHAKGRAKKIESVDVMFNVKMKDEDTIFGSITVSDIVDFYNDLGPELDRSEVKINEGPIKSLGEHDFNIQFHPDVVLELTCNVSTDAVESTVEEISEEIVDEINNELTDEVSNDNDSDVAIDDSEK